MTAFPNLFFITSHRESRDRDHRDRLQSFLVLQPLGHLEAGDVRQLPDDTAKLWAELRPDCAVEARGPFVGLRAYDLGGEGVETHGARTSGCVLPQLTSRGLERLTVRSRLAGPT